ncbi:MAG: hypothetical protein RJA07_978 [Bacteroidota bacterium]|jgi:hypothetical protein
MKTILAFCVASIYGITIRIAFGLFDQSFEIMSIVFLILVPFIIGYLTIVFLPKHKVLNYGLAFFRPWLTCLIILAITIFLKVEGAICWIMIYPLFSIAAGIGGMIALYFRRKKNVKEDEVYLDDYAKKDTLKLSMIMILPLLFGFVEGDKLSNIKNMEVAKVIIVNAPIHDVWNTITSKKINSINPNKKTFSVLLGFPAFKYAIADSIFKGSKRYSYYDKGLVFNETVEDYKVNDFIKLKLHCNPDSIPANVMDEHILIGGKHANIEMDEYKLIGIDKNHTKLILSSQFSINTPINWYASIWANYLMGDILNEQLKNIKINTKSTH